MRRPRWSSTLPKLAQITGPSSHHLAAPNLFRLWSVRWRRPQLRPGSGRVENVCYGLLGLALTTTTKMVDCWVGETTNDVIGEDLKILKGGWTVYAQCPIATGNPQQNWSLLSKLCLSFSVKVVNDCAYLHPENETAAYLNLGNSNSHISSLRCHWVVA